MRHMQVNAMQSPEWLVNLIDQEVMTLKNTRNASSNQSQFVYIDYKEAMLSNKLS